jgi:cytochrome c oxidase subunit 1
VGGRVFSDPLSRLAFVMFLLFSTPIGVHHQFTENGISPVMKAFHAAGTFVVFTPSMLTAFSLMAMLEAAGRARGGKGLFGWIPKLPWRDPSVTAQLLSMLVFLFGGSTGLINASYNVNLVVHNTAFIPGHFHLTVGTAVALSIIGICYWLVPYLTGKRLWGRELALVQAVLWAGGVVLFSRGQMAGGIEAMPRRTAIGLAPYVASMPQWNVDNLLTAIGGIVMVLSGLLFFVVIAGTLLGLAGQARNLEVPVGPVEDHGLRVWPALDRWGRWLAVAVAMVLVVYLPVFASYLPYTAMSTPWRVW